MKPIPANLYTILLAICFLASHSLQAEEAEYNCRFWTVKDGLPHNSVQALYQTSDGFLWVGTEEGLMVFDGLKFTRVAFTNLSRLEHASITSLAETSDRSVWIGTLGLGLIRYDGTTMTRFTQTNGLPRSNVRALFPASDGTLWVGTDLGAARYRAGKLERVTGLDYGGAITAFCEDKHRQIYLATLRGIGRETGGETRATLIDDVTTANLGLVNARALAINHDGELWAGANRTLVKLRLGSGKRGVAIQNLVHEIVSVVHEDRDGNLWIGTYGGLNLIPSGAMTPIQVKHDGEPFDYIQAIREDREGNLWIGTKEGLARLQRKSFRTYSRNDGLRHNNVTSIAEDEQGRLWIGTWGGGLHSLYSGKFVPKSSTDYSGSLVTAIYADNNERIWFGVDNAVGLFYLESTNIHSYMMTDGFTAKGPRVIRKSRAGLLWIGARDGIFSFDGRRFVSFTADNGLSANNVWDIWEDSNERIWAATDKGVDIFENGRWHRAGFTKPVRCFYQDSAGTLWLGTRQGLVQFQNGHFHGITNDALPQTIFGMIEDNQHTLWLASPTGVYAVSKGDLEKAARQPDASIKPVVYDISDGLLTESCNGAAQPSCAKTRDGRLWFATTKGLTSVDPTKARQINPIPPLVAIEKVFADKKCFNVPAGRGMQTAEGPAGKFVGSDGTISVPPGQGEMEFVYTALSFNAAEKNRFRYKLERVDSDWVTVGTRRAAYYYNLPPGEYAFHVIACNNDGVWSMQEAMVRFTLQPHYWQTWWFRASVIIVALVSAAGAARLVTKKRLERTLRRLEQQHALEQERARIAQDIHDDLGARLTEIMFLNGAAAQSPDAGPRTKESLSKANESARELVQTLDAIVWTVEPRNDTLENLVSYLQDHAERFLLHSRIQCFFEVPTNIPARAISSEMRHNIFLVVKEALNNIAKRARASEVKFQLCLLEEEMIVEICDNGCGFSSGSSGNGLRNMEDRLKKIGGSFRWQSEPGKGTRVRFLVPVPSAVN